MAVGDERLYERHANAVRVILHLAGAIELHIDAALGKLEKIILVRVAVKMAKTHMGEIRPLALENVENLHAHRSGLGMAPDGCAAFLVRNGRRNGGFLFERVNEIIVSPDLEEAGLGRPAIAADRHIPHQHVGNLFRALFRDPVRVIDVLVEPGRSNDMNAGLDAHALQGVEIPSVVER